MRLLIQNGTLVNPRGKTEGDISVRDGVIEAIGPAVGDYDRIIDAAGLVVMPGLIDMHVHLRDPGLEYKEDIISGTMAAAKGGFTAVCCMPNTDPVIDNEAVVKYIIDKAEKNGYARVYPIACITKGQNGQTFDALIISHAEDLDLINGGVMNESENSTLFGLKGISRAAEEVMEARDIILQETYGGKLHLAHISTKGAVELVRSAKKRGVPVTAETAPHYYTADDSWVGTYDTNTKVNPPLRTKEDVEAIKAGLADGTIDCIATDHAPHHADEKNVEYDMAANGISGIETAVPLTLELVRQGVITLERMAELMSCRPAEILGIEGGVIEEGKPADITILDTEKKYVFWKEDMVSKGKNSPFIGMEMQGRAAYTIIGGNVKVENGELK